MDVLGITCNYLNKKEIIYENCKNTISSQIYIITLHFIFYI